MIKGADISVWQAGVSYDRLAELARFVICKATQDTWTDSSFTEHFHAVKRRQLVAGAYHFLVRAVPVAGAAFTPSASPAAQARAYVAAVRAANGGTLVGALCALDWEPYDRKSGSRVVFSSRPRWQDAREWVAAFRELAPRQPLLIYSRSNVIGSADLTRLPGPCYVWLALWNSTPGAAPKRVRGLPVVIHQYGYLRPMKVDGNVYRGSLDELRGLTRPKAGPAPTPDPDPTPDPEPAPALSYCLRLQGLSLHPSPQRPPVALALYGAPLRVVAGPSGGGTAPAGTPPGRWCRVLALGSSPLTPPLWAELEPGAVGPLSPLPSR